MFYPIKMAKSTYLKYTVHHLGLILAGTDGGEVIRFLLFDAKEQTLS